VNDAVQMCVVCQTPLEPDEEVIQAVRRPSDHGGDVVGRQTVYAHVGEDAQVMALGGWTITGRGRLGDLTSRDLTESTDRI
jgi:hypothetical protein